MSKIKNEYKIQTGEWHSEVLTSRCVMHPDITIKTVKDISGILKLKDLWNNVVLNSSRSTIYQTYEWLYNWWNYFAADYQNSLHILLVLSSDKLIGIAPFFIKRYTFGGFKNYQQLKLIGSGLNSGASRSNAIEEYGVSDYLDIIVIDGYEKQVADAIVSYLHDFRYFFNEIDFQNVSEESFIFTWLLPRLEEKNFKTGVTKTDICPRLKVPGSMDGYLRSLKASTRRKLRQIQKQTAGIYPNINGEKKSCTEINNVNDKSFLHSFQTLKHLHQSRWNELGYLGLFTDKRFEKFIANVSEEFLKKDWLWFKVAKLDDKIIGARLAYKFKDNIYDYLSGFDYRQDAASLRPGIALIYIMIKDAISNNFKTVDLLRGAEEYKFELSSNVCNNYRIVVFHSDSLWGLRAKMFNIVKARRKLMFRIKTEIEMIKLQIGRHGKLMFLHPYLRFCFNRLKSFTAKNKVRSYKAKKIPGSRSKNKLPGDMSNKSENYYSSQIEEVEVHL